MEPEKLKQIAREIGTFRKTKDDVVRLLYASGIIPRPRLLTIHLQYSIQRYAESKGVDEVKDLLRNVIENYFTENPELSQVVLKMTGCLEPKTDEGKLQKSEELMEVLAVTMADVLLNTKPEKL